MVVRPECFRQDVEENRSSSSGSGYGKGAGGLGARGAPAPLAVPTAAAPAAPPRKTASDALEQLSQLGDVGGREAEALPNEGAEMPDDDATVAGASTRAREEKKPTDERGDADREEAPVTRRIGRALDWGAVVYLSNDDSQSLASAQRLLYAARADLPFTPDQVRPHELLNYFSFDTTAPARGDAFGITGSAERTAEGVSLALSVKGAVPAKVPLDLTLLVDRSCSMEEEGRMDFTRRGLERMVAELDAGDRVDLVLFDDAVCTPLENWVAGRDPERVLIDTLSKMAPRGSTDLDLGLREAYKVARAKGDVAGRNRRLMVVTDALLNTGEIDEDVVSDVGTGLLRDGIHLTAAGVGREFNDAVLQKLTEKGRGAYVFLGSEAVVDRIFGVGFDGLVNGLADDVQFALDLPPSLAIERFYGEESSTVAADVQPVHFQAGNSQLFLQELAEAPRGASNSDPIALTITYTDAATGRRREQVWTATVGDLLAADPHNVRKGTALMRFADVLVSDSMGARCDADSLRAWSSAAGRVDGDAEIAFATALLDRRCPGEVPPAVARTPAVPFKVKLDSDVAIGEVALTCDGLTERMALSASTSVARFDARPGLCTATLVGPVDLVASVTVPATGGETRCLVRGGRVRCTS
jgi:Ca-activated chloride channel family protein